MLRPKPLRGLNKIASYGLSQMPGGVFNYLFFKPRQGCVWSERTTTSPREVGRNIVSG